MRPRQYQAAFNSDLAGDLMFLPKKETAVMLLASGQGLIEVRRPNQNAVPAARIKVKNSLHARR
jgi:hypothetical protein